MSGRNWCVQVLVVQARGLSKPSMAFSQSPYATITLIDAESEKRVRDKQYTKVHPDGNKNAIWNEFFSFKGDKNGLTEDEVHKFQLFVGVRAKYNMIRKTKLGDFSLDLKDWKGKQSEKQWHDIFNSDGLLAGEVQISLSVVDLNKRKSGPHTEKSFKESLRRLSKPTDAQRKLSMKMMKPEDMCGYLWKRGRGIHANWKKRYFQVVIAEDELKFSLEYFKHKSYADKSSNRQGVVVIIPESGVERCEIDNRSNTFKLTDTSGATLARTDNFYLQAESEDGARIWIKAIKELLERINRADRQKKKSAVTLGAKVFLDLSTLHKGVLFQNDDERIGKVFAELHGDDATSALILYVSAPMSPSPSLSILFTHLHTHPPIHTHTTRTHTTRYDNEGDKFCDACLELANAIVTVSCDELSLSIQLESGAKYVFRTVEVDTKTGSAVIVEWGLKLKESGCKLVKEKRLFRVAQVRKKRLRSKQSSSGSLISRHSTSGSKVGDDFPDDEDLDNDDTDDKFDQDVDDMLPKTPMSPLEAVITNKFNAFTKKKKKKKELSPEEKLRIFIKSLWDKLRVVPKELKDLENDKSNQSDESKIHNLLVEYHPPSIVVERKDGSVVVTPPSSKEKDSTPGAKIRRRSSSWKPHAGFMRFRQVMERRLHMCLEAVANPAVECVRLCVCVCVFIFIFLLTQDSLQHIYRYEKKLKKMVWVQASLHMVRSCTIVSQRWC